MSGALARVYEEHVDEVYGYLAYRHGSRAVAESLTRRTFEHALRAGTEVVRDSRGPGIALLTIARKLTPEAAALPEADTSDAAIPADLAAALDGVDRGERAVLALRFGAGLRGPDIASVLDLDERRVRQLLSRGLRRVRTELERESGGDGEQSGA